MGLAAVVLFLILGLVGLIGLGGTALFFSRQRVQMGMLQAEAMRAFNDRMHRRLRRAVWNEGGCRSWYLDEHGVNRTIWPGFTFEYWASTRKAKSQDYMFA